MQRYDENYRELITKLNSAYHMDQQEQTVRQTVFEKVDAQKQKLIEDIPFEEIKKIGAKVHSNITDIAFLTGDEKALLDEIKRGRKTKYKQVVFRLVGIVDTELIMQRYRAFLESKPVYHTAYLYKGLTEPVKVVYENRESVFPIHDARGLNREKQAFLLKSVLAAEMRREFDIEKDPVLRLQGYLTNTKEMLVIVSVYPHILYPSGIRAMLYQIFEGMIPQISEVPSIDEKDVRRLDEELKRQSVEYWKKLLLPMGKSMTIPGEKRKTEGTKVWGKASLYKELDQELTGALKEFCRKNNTSEKAVFLYTWGNLLGRYHDEKNPILLMAGRGDKMNLFPVKITRDMEPEKLCEIDGQLGQSVKFARCTVEDLEQAVGIAFPEYFRMVHAFLEFSELENLGAGKSDMEFLSENSEEDQDINLWISYQIFDQKISMNYLSKGGIMEMILENLHELFTEELSALLMPEQNRFDKTTFITAEDTDEERMYKIQLAQIALYLKESGIFGSVTVDEIMKLAEYCRPSTYLSNDIIISEKTRTGSIYILGEGKLEESLTASDGMVKSLRIMKKGCIFGIESLFPEGESKTTYTVVSPQAKLVEIDSEIFKEVLRRKPEGWIALLEKECDQKSRLQRLWTME